MYSPAHSRVKPKKNMLSWLIRRTQLTTSSSGPATISPSHKENSSAHKGRSTDSGKEVGDYRFVKTIGRGSSGKRSIKPWRTHAHTDELGLLCPTPNHRFIRTNNNTFERWHMSAHTLFSLSLFFLYFTIGIFHRRARETRGAQDHWRTGGSEDRF